MYVPRMTEREKVRGEELSRQPPHHQNHYCLTPAARAGKPDWAHGWLQNHSYCSLWSKVCTKGAAVERTVGHALWSPLSEANDHSPNVSFVSLKGCQLDFLKEGHRYSRKQSLAKPP